MLIQIDDQALEADLCAHFARSGFDARLAGPGTVEITRADEPDEALRRDVVIHLRVWQVVNPGATVTLLG
jgi:hypothetical protein